MASEQKIGNARKNYLLWIYWLTFLSGAVNVYAIEVLGTPITHHTGNVSGLAISIYENHGPSFKILLVLISFFLGSVISGALYCKPTGVAKKTYGYSLLLAGLLFIILDYVHLHLVRLILIALWMGIQNGMYMKYRGATVRTSHITGYLTDAGFTIGTSLRGEKNDIRKVRFYLFSILSFGLGGVSGAYFVDRLRHPLTMIGSLYLLCGVYSLWLRRKFWTGSAADPAFDI